MEFASKGVAGTALGLGIAGTVALAQNLGVLGGANGGLFGGMARNSGCAPAAGNCGVGCVDVSSLQAENAMLRSERYTDQQTLDTRDRIAAINKDVLGYVIDLGQKIAVNEAHFQCLSNKVDLVNTTTRELSMEASNARVREAELNKDIQCMARSTHDRFEATRNETASAIALLSQKMDCCCEKQTASLACAIDKMYSTFVSGKLVMPLSSICPAAAPLTPVVPKQHD